MKRVVCAAMALLIVSVGSARGQSIELERRKLKSAERVQTILEKLAGNDEFQDEKIKVLSDEIAKLREYHTVMQDMDKLATQVSKLPGDQKEQFIQRLLALGCKVSPETSCEMAQRFAALEAAINKLQETINRPPTPELAVTPQAPQLTPLPRIEPAPQLEIVPAPAPTVYYWTGPVDRITDQASGFCSRAVVVAEDVYYQCADGDVYFGHIIHDCHGRFVFLREPTYEQRQRYAYRGY